MNNAGFGKTMENLRKHVNVQLIHNQKRLKRITTKSTFHAVHLKKSELFLNKPSYVGFAILDMSKILMYDFHYNYIRKLYGHNATLLFTDTDSLCYIVETNDIYKDIEKNLDIFDTSNYSSSHFLYSDKNKKVLG